MFSTTRAQGCWLRMWCSSSPKPPAPTSSPSQHARLCQAQPPPQSPPQLPGSKCPQSSQYPLALAAGEPCASAWGTAGVFISAYCVSWPIVRWGQARKMNCCEQCSQTLAKPSSLPGA